MMAARTSLETPLATLYLLLVGITLPIGAQDLYKWPSNTIVENDSYYDYIVIGSGNGAVVGRRLADANFSVLLMEAGQIPSEESMLAGSFAKLPNTDQDWAFKSEVEIASQSQSENVFKIAAGKMLGGSSQMNHFIFLRADPIDLNSLAEITNDPSWSYDKVLPYYIKSENTNDDEIMNSEFKEFHGASGILELTRETHDVSEKYIDAFVEAGQERRLDLNGNVTYGYAQPFLSNNKKTRQSTALYTLTEVNNLNVAYDALVTKINIDENKNAHSVDFIDKSGEIKTVNARKEIILSAGVFNSPKLLKLSGIGPKDELESFDIHVIQDSPVGENLQDHGGILLVHKIKKPSGIPEDPLPTTLGFPVIIGAARINKSLNYPEYQTTSLLVDNATLVVLCADVFGYKNEICEDFKNGVDGSDALFTLVANIKPKSRGKVVLRSKDPNDSPMIYMNFLTHPLDLVNMVSYTTDFLKVQNSTLFKEIGAKIVTPNLGCDGDFSDYKFKECYVEKMFTTLYHPVGTCPIGNVVDGSLKVNGVNNLRVVDASVMTTIPKANPFATCLMIGEKAADTIIKDAESKQEPTNKLSSVKNISQSIFR